jgi:hypothetical protein
VAQVVKPQVFDAEYVADARGGTDRPSTVTGSRRIDLDRQPSGVASALGT